MTTHGKKMKLTVTKPKVEYTQWFELVGMQRSKLVDSQRSELESTQKSSFLAHLTQGELLSPLSVRRPFVRPLTFHILINSSDTTGPI